MVTALIMAGGEGTRFWPLSRSNRPKQFLKLTDDQKTMLQETVERIKELVPPDKVFIATNESYKEAIKKQLPEVPEENIIIEPYKRDTAACIGLASLYIEKKFPGSTMVVLPADHLIKNKERFINILQKAVMTAAVGPNLVTIGIEPTHPETGYGYIHFGELLHTIDEDRVYQVKEFTEKPDLDTAREFLEEGTYLWNSGMFVWRVETIQDKIEKHMPELSKAMERIRQALGTDLEDKVVREEFKELEGISIDYGIMEKASDIYVIPGDFGWDDLGSWPALERVKKVDKDGNVVLGKHYGIDTKNSIIHSEDKVVTTIGLKDIVIVNTRDAILICDKKRAQEVKEIREILHRNGMEECL
ncbi:mannose-1-phosphate guanylyltransferase [Halothermothrix orenii]|uniref:mannose-1-phosphate guanylyltransferase n=1 Tax=Halothermothrix orenii (strain H 168 / OCM 544 / DSM 9562) TaxID=373903 RepID=B8D179_HALOH|nr:mannose-1-phosphate guanylyltransferase [Halothermothrix orenii]ACL71031.1 Mannose-1-phosphate guanylyltransferase (GDP) [Halothermothrix orenii H 168]